MGSCGLGLALSGADPILPVDPESSQIRFLGPRPSAQRRRSTCLRSGDCSRPRQRRSGHPTWRLVQRRCSDVAGRVEMAAFRLVLANHTARYSRTADLRWRRRATAAAAGSALLIAETKAECRGCRKRALA